ncbi:MAG: hypothetical protein KF886_23560 [Candidatus Hydrogenedentes bacterium]|nr:hypothetical protein [Candidatus Hydrogenedentota bacterium]
MYRLRFVYLTLLSCGLIPVSLAGAQERAVLENSQLGLTFDATSGTPIALENKLTGETYGIAGDPVVVEAVAFRFDSSEARVASVALSDELFRVHYATDAVAVEVTYHLRANDHFLEKRVVLIPAQATGVTRVVVSSPTIAYAGLGVVEYRYPKFGRTAGAEPSRTYFGRTEKGGFFAGVAEPFDASNASGNRLTLAYAPSLKVGAGQRFACEPVYLGVYKRSPDDQASDGLPLWSESKAMVAMTSTVLGPPRHGLVPMACGWHSEMSQNGYATLAEVEADMASLDFLAACGIDWLSDSHPWGGETEKLHNLTAGDPFEIGPFNRRFLEHAQARAVRVAMWPTMNNSHPWSKLGKALRPDRPDWLMTRAPKEGESPLLSRNPANCLANTEFLDWLIEINLQGLSSGFHASWAIDGSFFGDGGWFTSIVPADCTADTHDHLPGDSNYACQRALGRLIDAVREAHPAMYIFTCRPPMDLGVWSLQNVDVCFTLLESGTADEEVSPLPGLSGQPLNVVAGDHIRTWSRARVHHDFFPHYVDQPLLFPSRSAAHDRAPNWPRGNLDYILLSAISSSPNQLYYMPTKTGIPEEDRAEIQRWLDWGRKNEEYLKVRNDLPGWPAAGRVDGSAHIAGDRGLVFLFNPNPEPVSGEFALTAESIGLEASGSLRVEQVYPKSDLHKEFQGGQVVRWEVPAESPVVLRISPAR